ncbi:MAG TPA: glycosyltransferase family 39 protein [Saprospiraceae bacterium]
MFKTGPALTFGLFTILVFISLYGYTIFTDGMFFDGVFYAAIANNLANGIGSFWEMQYTTTLHTSFHEQPPFVLFLQSLFFRMLGDSIFVERLYCFLFVLLNIYLIIVTWIEVVGKEKKYFWLPVLLWLSIPLNSWTFQNNLIEVTMSPLDLCAVYFILRGCRQGSMHWFVLGGLFTFLAFFSKGFQGLFPLAAPLLYWIIYRTHNFSRAIIQTAIVAVIPAFIISMLLAYPPARYFFELYFERRLGGTFNHLQDTTRSHFYLLYKLVMEMLVPVAVCLLIWLIARKNTVHAIIDKRQAIFFVGIGLTASLPLMVTLEQRPFYLVTSFPYFILGLSLMVLPTVEAFMETLKKRNWHVPNISLGVLILLAVTFISINAKNPKRDHDLIADLGSIQRIIPKRTTISISPEIETRWSLHAYFMRYNTISLDDKNKHLYFLTFTEGSAPVDSCYKDLHLPLKIFKLYECK